MKLVGYGHDAPPPFEPPVLRPPVALPPLPLPAVAVVLPEARPPFVLAPPVAVAFAPPVVRVAVLPAVADAPPVETVPPLARVLTVERPPFAREPPVASLADPPVSAPPLQDVAPPEPSALLEAGLRPVDSLAEPPPRLLTSLVPPSVLEQPNPNKALTRVVHPVRGLAALRL